MNEQSDADTQERVVKMAFQCKPALEAYAYGLLRDYSEAQDAVQDALIVVMKQYRDFREGSSMIAWTRAIVRRKVLQSMDRRKRLSTLQDRLLCDSIDAAFERVHEESREALRKKQAQLADCLEKLPERSRRLLTLIYMEKQSYSRASDTIKMSVEGVRKALYRAKEQLRKCVDLKTEAAS